MAVYKDNATGTWRVVFRFTNHKGERKQTQKRGFQTKREALAWEREQLLKKETKLDRLRRVVGEEHSDAIIQGERKREIAEKNAKKIFRKRQDRDAR